jgi:hypothetical protein
MSDLSVIVKYTLKQTADFQTKELSQLSHILNLKYIANITYIILLIFNIMT